MEEVMLTVKTNRDLLRQLLLFCYVVVMPATVSAQTLYDDVWGVNQDVFTDADPTTAYIYGYGATDGPYDWYEVAADILDSNNASPSANAASGWGTHMEADVVASLNWCCSAEGSYQIQSNHYRSDDGGITTQFLGFIGFFFDVGRITTRYYYINTVGGIISTGGGFAATGAKRI